MSELSEWLSSNGLAEYETVFSENDVRYSDLLELTEGDVRELALPLGARRRLLSAIERLRENPQRIVDAPSGNSSGLKQERVPDGPVDAQRRQLTVMFCDLVGSTALSEQMDAEDYRELLGTYQSAAGQAIRGHGGYIARYMGDGLLVYFGYPVAQEDDPERAVRAGLAIVDSVVALKSPFRLQVRVGIATGLVVVGDIVGEGASEEAAVLGETPNLAARLQDVAGPNTVLFSPATQTLLRGRVESEELDPVTLKGISKPITPYRAIRARSLSEVSEARLDSTPLIGREVELALISRAWRNAASGEGQAVLLVGEPGVGKSRLLRAFQETLDSKSRTRIQWFCSPYHQTTANYPVIEQLKHSTGDDGLGGLESMVRDLGLDLDGLVPALALLMSEPLHERYDAPNWSPDELKRRLTQAQVQLLVAAAQQGPVLFIVEDLHWADPTTLDVLGEMIGAIRDEHVLILMTSRPEFDPPWTEKSPTITQRLSNLSRNETVTLVEGMVEAQGLSSDVIAEIVERTDGVPLFVEELTKNLLESAGEASIPASLQDSLMARLDRLGPTKDLAQVASVIGRRFDVGALTSLCDLPSDVVEQRLQALVASGLIFYREVKAYEFKHALIRDAAYDSMLRNRRRELHERYAEHLKQIGQSEIQPEVQAQHYAAAARLQDAVQYWVQAGERALARSASAEAVAHFLSALQALSELPATPAHVGMQVDCHLRVRDAYFALGQVEEGVPHLDSASEAVDGLSDPRRAALVSVHLTGKHWAAGDYAACVSLGLRALEQAELAGDKELCALAHYRLGIPYLQLGQVREATDHLDAALRYFNSDDGRECFEFGGYALCFTTSFLGWALSEIGRLSEAVSVAKMGYDHARSRTHGYSLACAAFGLARALILSGRAREAGPVLEEAMSHPETESTTPVRWILAQLAFVYAAGGDQARLNETRERFNSAAIAKMTDASSQFWMAQAELTAGNLELAERSLELSETAATERREDATGAWCKLVRADLELHRNERANLTGYVREIQDICGKLSLVALANELEEFEHRVSQREM